MKRRLLISLAVPIVLGAAAFFLVAPAAVEMYVSHVRRRPPYAAGERARRLHRTLFVADLHADTLLWDRDLLKRASRSHADLPRLSEGGVSLQAFTVVTRVPFGSNYESTSGDAADEVTPLAAGLVEITDALLAEGFIEEDIRKVMGGNVLRVLSATLPRDEE